jgi:hypothetical protein
LRQSHANVEPVEREDPTTDACEIGEHDSVSSNFSRVQGGQMRPMHALERPWVELERITP